MTHSHDFVVEGELTTTVRGRLPMPVLSTPGLIGMMELAAAEAAQAELPAGKATVGFEVCIKHVGAAGEGTACRSTAELLESIDGRKLRFAVEVVAVEDGRTLGVGTHERRVIDVPA